MARFTNQAQLNYNGITKNSNIAVGELRETLTSSKTAVRNTYGNSDTITYVLGYVNSSQTAVTDIAVSDNLGAYSFGANTLVPLKYINGTLKLYINGVLQPTPTVSAGPPLSISGFSIPANGSAVIVYETDVTEFAPLATDSEIVNTVTASSASLSTPIVATETVTTANSTNLSITKSISPVPVSDGETLTYTFTIQNHGNAPATSTDAVVLSDTFSPVLSNLSVSLNSAPLSSQTDYNYSTADGVFQTVAGVITVPAATFSQAPTTGAVTAIPGTATLTISGTV